MRNNLLKIFILTLTLVFTCCFVASASQEAIVQPRWTFMAYGECSLSQLSSGYVRISGETVAFSTVDVVKVTVYLQVYKNSNWQTVRSTTFTNNNQSEVYGYGQYPVEPFYNYRVVADHTVISNGYQETARSETTQMFID